MAINKVEINGEVKLDLTQDTVSEDTLLQGTTAHDAAGNPVEGKVVTTPIPVTEDVLKGDGHGGIDTMQTIPVEPIDIPVGIFKGTASGSIETAIPGTDYADVFIIDCTADGTVDDSMPITLTPSKTYDEVRNAILGQKQCYAHYAGVYYSLTEILMSAIESNNVTYAAFTAAKAGLRMSSIVMQHRRSNTDPVWTMYPLATALVAPTSATLGQVMAYLGRVEGWGSSNIGTNLSTNFSGLIKGSNGYLAQAEAGTDYMAPVAVTSADNGKFLRVVSGAWAAVSISDAHGGSF